MQVSGAQNGPSFHDTMNEVCRLTNSLEQKSGLKKQATESPAQNLVDDPLVVKTKGAPKGRKEREKRKCTECNNAGHSKRNCRARNDENRPSEGDASGLQAGSDIAKDIPKAPWILKKPLQRQVQKQMNLLQKKELI